MMLGSKDPNYDACGLFRAPRSSLPLRSALSERPPDVQRPTILPNIRISWNIHPTFMLISGRSQGLSPTYEQAHVGLDLLTLASLYHNTALSGKYLPAVRFRKKSAHAGRDSGSPGLSHRKGTLQTSLQIICLIFSM